MKVRVESDVENDPADIEGWKAILMPRITRREVINEFIDLVWERSLNSKYGRPRIYVAGRPFLTCSFLVVKIDTTDPANEGTTVEQLAEREGARVLEGQDAVGTTIDGYTLSEDDVMLGFKSSLMGWVEGDYKTEALGANLSFPLLRELANVGDRKAQRVLQSEIIKRLKEGHRNTTIVVLETCMDVIDGDTMSWIVKRIIEPHLDEFESETLLTFSHITDLRLPLAIALLGSKDPQVRKLALWRVRSHRGELTGAQKRQVFDRLKQEKSPWIIREFVELIDDPEVSDAILDTLITQAKHYQEMSEKKSLHSGATEKMLEYLNVIDLVVDNSATSVESLARIMHITRFKSMVDVEDSVYKQLHGFHEFDRRSTIIRSVIRTRRATLTLMEQAIDSLNHVEAVIGALPDMLRLRSHQQAAKTALEDKAHLLRQAITSDPVAGQLPMALATTTVYRYHSLRATREGTSWSVTGSVGLGPAGNGRAAFEVEFKDRWEYEEYLRYTGLEGGGNLKSDVESLAGTYTLTLYSGTWKALQDFANEQGMKMGRAPFVIPMLGHRVYESVYFKDGRVYKLDEHSTPAARLWSRIALPDGGNRWERLVVSTKLADYLR